MNSAIRNWILARSHHTTPRSPSATTMHPMMLATRNQLLTASPNDFDNPIDDASGPGIPDLLPVDRRAATAAEQLRLSTAAIERLPFDLSALEAGGILINVDTRNFGLLDRRLDWQALGIALPRGTELAFRPPRCGLVPDRYRLPLLRPAAQAHSALHAHSYRFQLVETVLENPSYRWLPWRAWPEFERAFGQAQTRLDAALDAYGADFSSIYETLVGTFRQLATESARRLDATGHPVSTEFVDLIVRGMLSVVPHRICCGTDSPCASASASSNSVPSSGLSNAGPRSNASLSNRSRPIDASNSDNRLRESASFRISSGLTSSVYDASSRRKSRTAGERLRSKSSYVSLNWTPLASVFRKC